LKILKLETRFFRNLVSCVIEPCSRINVILGKNAQGKTNLLEAIYVVGHNRSFRGARDKDLVTHGRREGYRLKVTYALDERIIIFEQRYSESKNKVLRLNNKPAASKTQHRLKSVVFTPEDLYLIKGEPERRRNFLDGILCQLRPEYERTLESYKKILGRRNAYLKQSRSFGQGMRVLQGMFIEAAVPLICARLNLAAILEKEVSKLYQLLSGEAEDVCMRYVLSFPLETGKLTPDLLAASLDKALEVSKDKELKQGITLVGPHRDDFNLYLRGHNARTYASQGQQRNLAVSLKLGELATYKNIKGYFPVLLLDEVLAELDKNRRTLLLEYLQQAEFQTFISSVEREDVVAVAGKVFAVEDGRITEEVG